MYEVRGRIRWLKRSRIPGNELAGHYSVRLAGFFTRPSIAANLSSQSGGNHESPPFLLSFFLGTMHFFPLRLPLLTSFFLRRAHREIRTTSDEGFTSSSFRPPSTLAPFRWAPLKFCRPVVYPKERSSLLRGFGSFVAPRPVVGDETTPMQKTQRGRPHLIPRGLLKPRGIRNCAIVGSWLGGTPPL